MNRPDFTVSLKAHIRRAEVIDKFEHRHGHYPNVNGVFNISSVSDNDCFYLFYNTHLAFFHFLWN